MEIYRIQKLNIRYIDWNVRKVLNEGNYVQWFFPHDEAIPEERKINNQIILLVKRDRNFH